jgi:hypothetical protein
MNPMTTIKYVFIIGIMLTISSCVLLDDDCDPAEQKIAFTSADAQFKKEVILGMPSYIQLKDFIIKNLPAILAHNHNISILVKQNANGRKDTTKYENSSSYSFYDYGKGNEIKDQVPKVLYPELKRIYQNFNKSNFYAVHFSRDSSVTISITNPSEYNEKGIGINHRLEWRNPKDKNHIIESNTRDTILNGAIYTVFIHCYRGI